MPRTTLSTQLETALTHLRAERQKHLDALAELDAVFAKVGISPDASVRRGRKPGPKPRKRRRGHFDQTGEEFVIGLLSGKALTTAQINAAWKKAGRGGWANNTLLRLIKAKKIKRSKLKVGKGSEYRVG